MITSSKIKVSICVCAYNEDATIAKMLQALLEQKLIYVEISEIIVVSSACTDATDTIVKAFAERDSRIKLVAEKERTGKPSAINLFLKEAKEDIYALVNADILPDVNMIENLCLPFKDASIGMTGAEASQLDSKDKFYGFAWHMARRMLNTLSVDFPKLGDVVAFRKVDRIDPYMLVDESYLEYLITKRGLKLLHVPSAKMLIHGSTNWHEYTSQRIRIHIGHYGLHKKTGYKVSTLEMIPKAKIAIRLYLVLLKHVVWFPLVVLIEIYCLLVASWKFNVQHANPYVWEMIKTSKTLERE
jgi:glycosyltransferase involved in cell wall biosynthesis